MGDNKISEVTSLTSYLRERSDYAASFDNSARVVPIGAAQKAVVDAASIHLQGEAVPVCFIPPRDAELLRKHEFSLVSMHSRWEQPNGENDWVPVYLGHPQPAALNEVSGNSGELGGDEREKFDTWLETISVDTTHWGDGNYTDPTAHNYWLAWLAALAATGKQQGGPDGWAFKVIDGKWAVSNPCCGMSHFLHAPSLHAWSCEQRMKPVDSSSQQGGDVQGDGLATLQQDYDNLLAAFDRQVAAAVRLLGGYY